MTTTENDPAPPEDQTPEELPAIDDAADDLVDHDDVHELTEDDAARGHAAYLAVDDLDDESTGLGAVDAGATA